MPSTGIEHTETRQCSPGIEAFLPQSRDELASRRNVTNRIDALARVQRALRDSASFVGPRTSRAVTTFLCACDGVRREDVALTGAFAGRWAAGRFPHLEGAVTQRAMRRI